MNESMNDEAVYRTAPAAPGLLIKTIKLFSLNPISGLTKKGLAVEISIFEF